MFQSVFNTVLRMSISCQLKYDTTDSQLYYISTDMKYSIMKTFSSMCFKGILYFYYISCQLKYNIADSQLYYISTGMKYNKMKTFSSMYFKGTLNIYND